MIVASSISIILHSSSSSPTVALFSPVPHSEFIQSTPAIERREKCVNTVSGYCTPFACFLSLTPSQAAPPCKRAKSMGASPRLSSLSLMRAAEGQRICGHGAVNVMWRVQRACMASVETFSVIESHRRSCSTPEQALPTDFSHAFIAPLTPPHHLNYSLTHSPLLHLNPPPASPHSRPSHCAPVPLPA